MNKRKYRLKVQNIRIYSDSKSTINMTYFKQLKLKIKFRFNVQLL